MEERGSIDKTKAVKLHLTCAVCFELVFISTVPSAGDLKTRPDASPHIITVLIYDASISHFDDLVDDLSDQVVVIGIDGFIDKAREASEKGAAKKRCHDKAVSFWAWTVAFQLAQRVYGPFREGERYLFENSFHEQLVGHRIAAFIRLKRPAIDEVSKYLLRVRLHLERAEVSDCDAALLSELKGIEGKLSIAEVNLLGDEEAKSGEQERRTAIERAKRLLDEAACRERDRSEEGSLCSAVQPALASIRSSSSWADRQSRSDRTALLLKDSPAVTASTTSEDGPASDAITACPSLRRKRSFDHEAKRKDRTKRRGGITRSCSSILSAMSCGLASSSEKRFDLCNSETELVTL
ncbi:hypothetical protein QE369_002044 [Agrobacterium larrymoorei]|uniref:Uncharacterized protein n=1 Tax=Agrobacterium larrymoorei TaxID=160699 RepID=A0AAJ2EUV6_9HYPH|nr:hypothetical protein [Agrobacterium larrymoorei]MDR6101847.1 hypothetical protein [Agrobacterium larrymoorei]